MMISESVVYVCLKIGFFLFDLISGIDELTDELTSKIGA